MEETGNAVINVEQKEGIKLTRNAKGFYQWEIKTKSDDLGNEDLAKLFKIDEELRKTYPLQ